MRVAQYLAVVGAAALLVVWNVQGRHAATLHEELVVVEQLDDFGDMTKVESWKPTLKLGLLDAVLPGLAASAFVFIVATVLRRRRTSQRASLASSEVT